MTFGLATESSEACTFRRYMTDPQTTLSEFGDEAQDGEERGDGPTPKSNASEIQHLVSVVEELTERLGTLAEQVEPQDGETSTDDEPIDERMFY
jgi:hypothetical protein